MLILRKILLLPLGVFVVLLSACGGGGSSSSGGSSGVTLSPSITANNASTLFYDAAEASNYGEDSRGVYSNLSFFHDTANWTGYTTGSGSTTACTGSGSRSAKFTDADNSGTLTAGDYWITTYTACNNSGSSDTNTGTHRSDVVALSVANPLYGPSYVSNAWTATVKTTVDITSAYSSTTPSVGTYKTNVVVSYALTATATNSLTVVATPSTFVRSYTKTSGNLESYGYTNMVGSLTYTTTITSATTGTVPYTKTGSYYLYGSDNGISLPAYTVLVTYPTTVSGLRDVSTSGHNTPTSGVMKVTGASSTSVSLNAAQGTILNLDLAGAGTTTHTQSFTTNLASVLTP